MAEGAVRARLRDADSAEFAQEYVDLIAVGGRNITVCGLVNARNGFGGRAGYEHFVAVGSKTTFSDGSPTVSFSQVFMEEATAPRKFAEYQRKYCTGL